MHHSDVGHRDGLEDADVVDSRETSTQLSEVEHIALVDPQGAAKRGIVDSEVASKGNAPDRMRRSDPDARGHVHRRAGVLHLGGEIEAAFRLAFPSLIEQVRTQRVDRGRSAEAYLERMIERLPGRHSWSDERQA